MGCFLQFCNLSQAGIETQRLLGTSCSSKVLSRYRANIAKERLNVVNNAIKKALEQKHAILMMIDDYHNIHTVRRPTEEGNTCRVDHMATIIIKIVKEAPAVPFSSVNLIHNPCGVDSDLLVNYLCSNHFFDQVSSNLFASSMPELTYSMFDPVMGGHRMEAHDYQVLNLQSLRSFKDFYLANFLTLPLKSRKDYNDAFDIVLQTSMREYLSNYVVLMPADWPGQFFPRQIVYQKARQATSISTVPQGSSTHPLCCHSHFRALACRP